MKKSDIIEITAIAIGVAIIVTGFGWFFYQLGEITKESNTKRNKNYQECKLRTQDVEWCIKVTKPNLK